MWRRVLLALSIVGTAACLSSNPATASGRAVPVQRLRGGGDFRIIRAGVASESDSGEPFLQKISNPKVSTAQLVSSDSDGSLYDPDWSAAREELTEIIMKRDAAAAMHLRGGSSQAAADVKVPAGKVLVSIRMTAHHIHPKNSPPVKVVVCGGCDELGNWDIAKGIELKAQDSDTDTFNAQTDGMFPVHTGSFMLPAGKEVEFKYAVTKVTPGGDGIATQWESMGRKITLPASGVLELRNEFMEGRDTDPRITDEPFQCNAQEWMRYYKHHISGLQEAQPGREG